MNPIRPFVILSIALGLLAPGLVLAQAGTGNLYRVTSKIEMEGMPFPMPSRPVEVCGPKNQASDKMVPHDENCTVSNFRVAGNKSSFTMTCTGEDPMTATGEFEQLGQDAYRGRMQMKGQMEGEPMNMTMNFEGKRIRDCNYATESPEAQGRAMMAKTCEQVLGEPSYLAHESFTGANAMCASFKPRYCSAMLSASLKPDVIRSAEQINAAGVTTIWNAFSACGTTRPAALAKTCTMAQASRDYPFIAQYCPGQVAKVCASADVAKDYEFVVGHCPVQAKAAAAAHCAGRDFTAMMGSPYSGFCSRYAGGQLKQRNEDAGPGGAATTLATPATPEEAPKKPSWRDRLKSAADTLTGED